MEYTQHFNLKLPDGTDLVEVEDLNGNAEIIDSMMALSKVHEANKNNPHEVTKKQVGLENVANVLQASQTDLLAHASNTSHIPFGIATGSNSLMLNVSGVTVALIKGQGICFENTTTNTGAVQLNLNGLGSKPVVKSNGAALTAGNLRAGGIYTVRYSGTNFQLQGEGGEYGTATAADVLAGKTIGTDAGIIEGSMVNRGAVESSLNAGGSYNIPQGYHNGSGIVRALSLSAQTVADALAANLLVGKTAWVNGAKITGTMPDNGNVAQTLNAGAVYTIPSGYHGGTGKVTGNSLASQTAADATAPQILAGKTAWVNGAKLTGTMTSRAAQTITPSTANQVIQANQYLAGAQTVAGSANLVAANIVSGKDIFGVNGTAIVGKRMATGTATTGSDGYITVTGLAFKPSVVVTKIDSNSGQLWGSAHALQTAFSSGASGKYDAVSLGGSAQNGGFSSGASNFSCKSTSASGVAVHWIAYEV